MISWFLRILLFPLIIFMLHITGYGKNLKVIDEAISKDREFKITEFDRIQYISLNDLVSLTEAKKFWRRDILKMVLRVGEHRVKLCADNFFVVIDDEPVNINYPVRFYEGSIFLPVNSLPLLMGTLLQKQVLLDAETSQIFIKSEKQGKLKKIRLISGNNESVLYIFLTQKTPCDLKTQDGNLTLSFQNLKFDEKIAQIPGAEGLIQSFILKEDGTGNDLILTLTLSSKTAQCEMQEMKNEPGYILRIFTPDEEKTVKDIITDSITSVQADNSDSASLASLSDKTFSLKDCYGFARNPDNEINVVAIDPGHGGRDTGAKDLTMEKNISLEIAAKLNYLIRTNGEIMAIMTRDKDLYVPVTQRIEIANQNHANLYISIHINASYNNASNGIKIYFLSRDKRDEEIQDQVNELIPWSIVQKRFTEISKLFSEILKQELSNDIQMRVHGIEAADLYMLYGANMPAVLLEIGYLTNSGDEELLMNQDFQAKITDRIYQSILRFRYQVGKKSSE